MFANEIRNSSCIFWKFDKNQTYLSFYGDCEIPSVLYFRLSSHDMKIGIGRYEDCDVSARYQIILRCRHHTI